MNERENQQEVTLGGLVLRIENWGKYLISKWYILLISIMVGASIGYFYSKTKKAIYTATTTFVLESGEQGGGLGQYAGMAAMVGINVGSGEGGIFQGDNLLELYKSRKMIEAALLRPVKSDSSKIILDLYLDLDSTRNQWKEKSPKLLGINFRNQNLIALRRERDSIIQKAVLSVNKSHLKVGMLDKKASIFKVDILSHNEVFSKELNEELVKQVNEFYISTKTKKSLQNISILQRKTDSVRSVMNEKIGEVAYIVDQTPNLNPTKQAQRIIPTQRSQFSVETNKAILAQLVQSLELSKVALMKEAPLIQEIDNPVYPLVKTSLGGFKAAFLGAFLCGFIAMLILTIKNMLLQKPYTN